MGRQGMLLFVAVLAVAFFAMGTTSLADTPPTVTIDPPTDVSYTTAHISGTVNPNGGPAPTFWRFEYTTEPGNPAAEWLWGPTGGIFGSEAEATAPIAVEGTLSVAAGTQYAVRLVAENGEGANIVRTEAPYPTFTTLPVTAPSVTIDPVTAVTGTSAHFSGTVDPNGSASAFDSNWHFECEPACPGFIGGTVTADGASHSVSAEATGLEPNTAYQVKLVASNAGGRTESADVGFETGRTAPEAQTLYAGSIGTGSATLAALVNPRNSTTSYQFEWGTEGSLDRLAPASPVDLSATDDALHVVTAAITGLAPGTPYRFRIVATNTETSQSTTGAAHPFTTLEPSTAGSCANEEIRQEQGSTRLPDCRAYELVSPPDKNGGNMIGVLTASEDGNRVSATSSASFADPRSNLLGAPYMSERGPGGWVTKNMAPPGGVGLALDGGFLQFGNFSHDLTASLSQTANFESEPQIKNIFLTTSTGGTTWVTAPTQPSPTIANKFLAGASADLSHIVFESEEGFSSRETFGSRQIWEWVGGNVRLVSVLPDDSLAAGPWVGTGVNAILGENTGSVAMFPEPTAVSADGSRIFFSAYRELSRQLYVREDGSTTTEISLSQRNGHIGEESKGGAVFSGAARDGSRVVFTSNDELTNDATPGGGLYRYDLRSGELEFLSPTLSATSGPEIDGVVGLAADASKVYFVARAQLNPEEGVAGGHNLYVTGEDGVHFIATLANLDFLNWSAQGQSTFNTVRVTPDGDHMVFQSFNQLTGYESGGHLEAYEWDDRDGILSCVSCGAPGTTANGDASLVPAPANPETLETPNGQPPVGYQRAISDDGGRVFFETTDGLDPRDVNGKEDVYVYEEGRTHLLSAGTGGRASEIVGSSASGDDVFFSTNQSMVGQDTDGGAGDTYDARVGGGFAVPVARPECEGGDCQPAAGGPPFQPPGTGARQTGERHTGTHRAQRLRHALRACRKKSKNAKARKRCEAKAKRRFAGAKPSDSSRGI